MHENSFEEDEDNEEVEEKKCFYHISCISIASPRDSVRQFAKHRSGSAQRRTGGAFTFSGFDLLFSASSFLDLSFSFSVCVCCVFVGVFAVVAVVIIIAAFVEGRPPPSHPPSFRKRTPHLRHPGAQLLRC